jgi:hypothetical protein
MGAATLLEHGAAALDDTDLAFGLGDFEFGAFGSDTRSIKV